MEISPLTFTLQLLVLQISLYQQITINQKFSNVMIARSCNIWNLIRWKYLIDLAGEVSRLVESVREIARMEHQIHLFRS